MRSVTNRILFRGYIASGQYVKCIVHGVFGVKSALLSAEILSNKYHSFCVYIQVKQWNKAYETAVDLYVLARF